jgi:hypothetical protein
VQNNGLLRAATKTSTAAPAATTITGGCAAGGWFAAARNSGACTATAATPTPTTAVANHTTGERKRVVIRHFQIPCHATGLRYPRDHFPVNGAAFNGENRRIADFGDRPADLAGCIGRQIHYDGLTSATTTATAGAGFCRWSILLCLEGSRNVIGLPLSSQTGLTENSDGYDQHDGYYEQSLIFHLHSPREYPNSLSGHITHARFLSRKVVNPRGRELVYRSDGAECHI